jgi:hypothetical protein
LVAVRLVRRAVVRRLVSLERRVDAEVVRRFEVFRVLDEVVVAM